MTSFPFYSPELARTTSEEPSGATEALTELLRSDQLHELIERGDVTLAMIRPNVGPDANLESLPDVMAAEVIEGEIQGLGVMAKFSLIFDEEGIEEFYDGPAKTESMIPALPLKNQDFENRWDEFKNTMTSGPVTVFLLHSSNGDAVSTWRSHLGHWNIEEVRDPQTIRGRHGVDNLNNLVHGSDSPTSVAREVKIISALLERIQG